MKAVAGMPGRGIVACNSQQLSSSGIIRRDPKAKATGGGAGKFRIMILDVVTRMTCSFFFYGSSSVGRMLGLGPRGRGFESRFPYYKCPSFQGFERVLMHEVFRFQQALTGMQSITAGISSGNE